MPSPSKIAYGDWQTPTALADAIVDRARALSPWDPAVVLEPTCGEGAFLVSAAPRFPSSRLAGYEISPAYAATARRRLPPGRARVEVADFFEVDWERALAAMPDPICVVGNPPWVTSAGLGAIGASNLPARENWKGMTGYDALTGKSNFDVSEWMILRLVRALLATGRRGLLALLCKTAVARRVVETAARLGWAIAPRGLFRVDAREHFGAAVDAVLFACVVGEGPAEALRWPVYASLDAPSPSSSIGVVDGELVADAGRFESTRHLAGRSEPAWRSGIKHDCARVMELSARDGRWVNGLGERVEIEDDFVFPLLKSSDVANSRVAPSRRMVVPQRALGEDTSAIRLRAPGTWAYLSRHRALLDARRSSIYERRPPFAVFGVGAYAFAPWKVAVSGLYKRLAFVLVGPHEGRPVMLDDTCYLLPFEDEAPARRALSLLRSGLAGDFFEARVFWDAKRPISKALLEALDLDALAACSPEVLA
jgi:methylase of polypeptide subunit release factors